MQQNLDTKTVKGFGEEWGRFDQTGLSERELSEQFERYFSIFPWEELPENATGFDLGCGSGRWAATVADRCAKLFCIDASSEALAVARKNLSTKGNIAFLHASVDGLPLEDASMDFGYSLGVLHHVPDTSDGIKSCVRKIKYNAPFLVYLYYAFDNRPLWFRLVWKVSDFFRRTISVLPFRVKAAITDLIAVLIYFPFAKISLVLEKLGFDVDVLPLSTYRKHSFYTMRTDALDRFGTKLENRFTRKEIEEMMTAAGLERIQFNNATPYWCAVGYRKNGS